MDSRRRADDTGATADPALDFVRFCYRRRRVGWPELYDEMCAVAGRGLYRGWGFADMAEHGIGFGLSEMPRLAELVSLVGREEGERRGNLLAGAMARRAGRAADRLTAGGDVAATAPVQGALASAAH